MISLILSDINHLPPTKTFSMVWKSITSNPPMSFLRRYLSLPPSITRSACALLPSRHAAECFLSLTWLTPFRRKPVSTVYTCFAPAEKQIPWTTLWWALKQLSFMPQAHPQMAFPDVGKTHRYSDWVLCANCMCPFITRLLPFFPHSEQLTLASEVQFLFRTDILIIINFRSCMCDSLGKTAAWV